MINKFLVSEKKLSYNQNCAIQGTKAVYTSQKILKFVFFQGKNHENHFSQVLIQFFSNFNPSFPYKARQHLIYIQVLLCKRYVMLCLGLNDYNSPISRITYQTISELTFFMKVIQNFVVNNFYIIHFNDKVCWTSQILGENSWKIVTFFCCEFCFRRRRRGADDQCIKTNNKMSHFFQEFSPRICEVQQTLSLKWII